DFHVTGVQTCALPILRSGVQPIWLGLGLALGSAVAFFTQLHAWRLPAMLGTGNGLIVATGAPGVLYLLMAVIDQPALAVVLFIVQWGVVQLAIPLFAGLFNAHLDESARATSLSLISGVVTVYIGVGGVVLGWLAEWSLSGMFAILGVVILAGTILVRPAPEREEMEAKALRYMYTGSPATMEPGLPMCPTA